MKRQREPRGFTPLPASPVPLERALTGHSREAVVTGFTRLDIMIIAALSALVITLAISHLRGGRGGAPGAAAVRNVRALLSSWEMYRPVARASPAVSGGAEHAEGLAGYPIVHYNKHEFRNSYDES